MLQKGWNIPSYASPVEDGVFSKHSCWRKPRAERDRGRKAFILCRHYARHAPMLYFYAQERLRFGETTRALQSRFIEEIEKSGPPSISPASERNRKHASHLTMAIRANAHPPLIFFPVRRSSTAAPSPANAANTVRAIEPLLKIKRIIPRSKMIMGHRSREDPACIMKHSAKAASSKFAALATKLKQLSNSLNSAERT